jgi:competence protein ComEC
VDLILLSHPDLDHIGGTGAVLRSFPDAKIAVSDEFRNDQHMLSRLASWGRSPDDVAWLPHREAGRIGNFTVTIECPLMLPGEEDNDGSMFVRIQEDRASAVFSGDAPMSVEAAEAARGDWSAQILHVGHHGSKTATSETWLRAVHPKVAVISCGRNNRYGHPHAATLQRLAAYKIPVDRTDREGSIEFVVRNGEFVRER